MARIDLFGYLGADAKIVTPRNGTRFIEFPVGDTRHISKDETRTDWYKIISFDERFIGKLTNYLKKGKRVWINGDLNPAINISDKDGKPYLNLNVKLNAFEFIPGSTAKKSDKEDDLSNDDVTCGTLSPVSAPTVSKNDDDDDLPF